MEVGSGIPVAALRSTRRENRARARHLRSRRIRAVLAGGLVLGVGFTMTLAAWTDQELASSTVQAGTFSVSSRTVQTDPFVSHGAGNPATLQLNATGLYPGVSRAAWVQVQTSGSLGGTVTLTNVSASAPGAADQALLNALTAVIVQVAQPSACTPTTTSATMQPSPLTTVPTGAQLPPAALQGGGANTVTYCVVLTLPSTATTAAQGGTVAPTWTFTGTTG